MKKSILNVLILAFVIINLVMTSILAFAVIPSMKKTNNLIDKICEMVDLEAGGKEEETGLAIDQIATVDVTASDGNAMTVNLKPSTDGKDHYMVVVITLSLNKNSEDYAKKNTLVTSAMSLIQDKVIQVASTYTKEELVANNQAFLDELLSQIKNELFDGSDMIYKVTFKSFTLQ
ncbi:MAG: flagellar basal body-associated FliL family protein [Lachnospiraceae bacterium]|uniref:flagellar basal body-associated FliL family protein n=1 Tax=Falcatimonas sp. MSJ-15 TaxID=2841515 RepID=UPI001C128097|nr:flagellar basal body-associated FliL family protein [Falcatimonas sp. MSJ-15]MBQ5734095.1 flagellar basal body-associated FliL family protein [Lachnospiraceae bacterium]MBU5469660.1 flagellar basal body-associated FliL family protein [Falcatimonas sp. MSJ-15]